MRIFIWICVINNIIVIVKKEINLIIVQLLGNIFVELANDALESVINNNDYLSQIATNDDHKYQIKPIDMINTDSTNLLIKSLDHITHITQKSDIKIEMKQQTIRLRNMC